MAADLSEGCPRCGDEVRLFSKGLQCQTPGCGAYWSSIRAFQSECTARDLSGTRKKKGQSTPDSDKLKAQLDELVAAVRLNTLKEVHEAVSMAISGRDQKKIAERMEARVLIKMKEWIREQMDE
jgi:hypothetical protein